MNLIDKETLIFSLVFSDETGSIPCGQMKTVLKVVNAQPLVQPEIIRCKDCKKYDMHDHRCKHWNHGVVVMDWCSKAERRQA